MSSELHAKGSEKLKDQPEDKPSPRKITHSSDNFQDKDLSVIGVAAP